MQLKTKLIISGCSLTFIAFGLTSCVDYCNSWHMQTIQQYQVKTTANAMPIPNTQQFAFELDLGQQFANKEITILFKVKIDPKFVEIPGFLSEIQETLRKNMEPVFPITKTTDSNGKLIFVNLQFSRALLYVQENEFIQLNSLPSFTTSNQGNSLKNKLPQLIPTLRVFVKDTNFLNQEIVLQVNDLSQVS